MRLPRDVSGPDLIKALRVYGYEVSRQTGSHIRLTKTENGTQHITVPNHDPLRIGTLAAIIDDISEHLGLSRQELLNRLKL